MSEGLSVDRTVAVLRELREQINAFVARERALTRTRDNIAATQGRAYEAAVEEESARHQQAVAAAQTWFDTTRDKIAHWDTQRRARIRTAFANAKKHRLDRIEYIKGREIFSVQQETLATTREKNESLRQNMVDQAGLTENLNAAAQAVEGLRASARTAFRGYGKLVRLLAVAQAPADDHPVGSGIEEFNARYAATREILARFRRQPLPAIFSLAPIWVVLVLIGVLAVLQEPMLAALGGNPLAPIPTTIAALALAAVTVAAYIAGGIAAAPLAAQVTAGIAALTQIQAQMAASAAVDRETSGQAIESAAESRIAALNERWQRANAEAERSRTAMLAELEGAVDRLLARQDALLRARQDPLAGRHADLLARAASEHESNLSQLAAARDQRSEKQLADNRQRWEEMAAEWREKIPPLWDALRQSADAAGNFPPWVPERWSDWQPPAHMAGGVPFGRMDVNLAEFCEGLPQTDRLPLPGKPEFSLPLMLTFPAAASLLVESSRNCSGAIAEGLNGIILRLLSQSPPGRLNFTLLDPVGLGQNFAGVMHLADYEDSLINNRIWTQATEIEQRLSDLNKHIEKVIQLHLRNEYPTIREYNEHAGNIAEKYHFLVVADFPANFSETALRNLVNIAVSGARCGVYLLIHWDKRQESGASLALDDLRRNAIEIHATRHGFELPSLADKGISTHLESAPDPQLTTDFLHRVGEGWKDSNRIEVPFSVITPEPGEIWSLDTAEELRVPIGRAGAAKLQYFSVGRGTRQHTLVGGKTGSGKSTLFHVMVTNLSLWCSPEQVEFYLVDFKKGVEFKCYATHRLPHARVVAIESDREFGLGVLRRVDEELKRRGDLFRKLGVQNLAGYRATSREPLPRTLLLIDEFQEFFVEDDRIAQEANVLLDRVVRQGRAFGIHALLGSQTLGGAYTLARATMGQMVVRIALQCNEADAQLIMDDTNPAPRFLTRPGEGIYNDMAGAVEGNSPFQTVWLSEEERDSKLEEIRQRAAHDTTPRPAPFIFEGNAPSDIRENAPLAAALRERPSAAPAAAHFWLGEPNTIKGPTEAILHRQSGHNLLVVTQSEEAALAMLSIGAVSLAAQFPAGGSRIVWLDHTPPGSAAESYLRHLANALAGTFTATRSADLAGTLADLAAELQRRIDDPSLRTAPSIFLFVPGLQTFKTLRQEEDFGFSSEATASPAKMFADLLTDGPAHGIHVIAACDTYNNVMRYIGRKPLTEFEMRVLFQMSANDSASLIDSPRAGSLGLHRALLHNGQEGFLEIFRPYMLPDTSWLESLPFPPATS